jgi:hypothetical protein
MAGVASLSFQHRVFSDCIQASYWVAFGVLVMKSPVFREERLVHVWKSRRFGGTCHLYELLNGKHIQLCYDHFWSSAKHLQCLVIGCQDVSEEHVISPNSSTGSIFSCVAVIISESVRNICSSLLLDVKTFRRNLSPHQTLRLEAYSAVLQW